MTSGSWYAYATGGVAFGRVRSNTQISYANDAFFLALGNFYGSASETKIGWTAGGGIEYAFGAGNWSIKAEYLHVDLGRVAYSSVFCNLGGCPNIAGVPFTGDTTIRIREHIARVGLNYRFGGLARN
jgi:outer membrane immunogenic protein